MRGTIQEFSLADVIKLISEARKSGVLDVGGSQGSGRVLFRDGAVCGAESTLAREPLGRKLVRAGVLSEGQLWNALGRQDRSQVKLGETLVSAGLAARDQIDTALREQVEEGIVAVLRLEPTDFSWSAQDSEGEVVVLVDDLLATLSAKSEELASINRNIPSERMTVAMAALPPTRDEIRLTSEDWRILAFLGARRTVADLLHYSGAGEVHMLRSLDRLISAGLVEVADPSTDPRRKADQPTRRAPTSPSLPPPPPPRAAGSDVIRLAEPEAGGVPVDTFRIAFVGSDPRGLSAQAGALLGGHTRGLPYRVAIHSLVDKADSGDPQDSADSARPLKHGAVADMDLVLGFDWSQVENAVVTGGASPDKTFTIVELWALVDSGGETSTSEAARRAVARAHTRRIGHAELMSNLQMEEPGDSPAEHARLRDICASLAKALFG